MFFIDNYRTRMKHEMTFILNFVVFFPKIINEIYRDPAEKSR